MSTQVEKKVMLLWPIRGTWGSLLILIIRTSLLVSIAVLAQVGSGSVTNASEADVGQLNPSPVSSSSPIDASRSVICDIYYFRSNLVNVGQDGNQKIANTTAPFADVPDEVSAKLTVDREIARFYSNPPVTDALSIVDDITGLLWVRTNLPDTSFNIEVFDYTPSNGDRVLLGEFAFTLLSAGETSVEYNIPPPADPIAADHRLLFVLIGKKSAPPPNVGFLYDSADRASQFTICQPTGGGAPPEFSINLPIIFAKKIVANAIGPFTELKVKSINTGGINPVRVLNPNNNRELLSCSIENDVTKICGSFPTPTNGTYKIVAHTNNCGSLQGVFTDAKPGGTVTRTIFCN